MDTNLPTEGLLGGGVLLVLATAILPKIVEKGTEFFLTHSNASKETDLKQAADLRTDATALRTEIRNLWTEIRTVQDSLDEEKKKGYKLLESYIELRVTYQSVTAELDRMRGFLKIAEAEISRLRSILEKNGISIPPSPPP